MTAVAFPRAAGTALHRARPAAVETEWATSLDGVGLPKPVLPLQPLVLRQGLYEELFVAAREVLRLVRRAAHYAGDDAAARVAALGQDPADFPFFRDDVAEELYADCMARPDMVLVGGVPRILEINVGGAIGGAVGTHLLQRAWERLLGGDEGRPRVFGYRPFAARADLFGRVCAARGLRRAVVLLGSLRDVPNATSRYFDVELDYLRRSGFSAEWAEPEDLVETLGVPAGELRYPVGLAHFTIEEWRLHGIDPSPVREALDAGCLLLAPQAARLLDNKKTLAWVSEGQPWMTGADRALVERYVPWTRVVSARTTSWRGQVVDLPSFLVERREDLVLKRAVGMWGEGVTLGWQVSEAEWAARVECALVRRDSIVQEYAEPDHVDLWHAAPDGGESAPMDVAPVVSPFLIGGQPAGCMVRYLPAGGYGIVSVDGFGAMLNVAMTERR